MILSYPRHKYKQRNIGQFWLRFISILNFRAMSDTARTLVRREAAPEKRRKSSHSLFTLPHRDIGILFVGYTSALYSSFYILLSCARAKTRDAIAHTPPQFEHCRALSAVIGPWCHTMGQTMRGTIHPLLLETIRPSSPGAPTHPSTVDFSPLLESAHPANLINIIADYAAPRSQWELRAKRYRRYEALALCAPLSLCPGYPERIIHRQTCHRGLTIHDKLSLQEKK